MAMNLTELGENKNSPPSSLAITSALPSYMNDMSVLIGCQSKALHTYGRNTSNGAGCVAKGDTNGKSLCLRRDTVSRVTHFARNELMLRKVKE
jgi:hypothetical protein